MFKLTPEDVTLILDALQMAEASARRGKNTKSAQFAMIYDKILTDIAATRAKLLPTGNQK